jgi:hypothetical protein
VEEGRALPPHPLHAFAGDDYRRLISEQVREVRRG